MIKENLIRARQALISYAIRPVGLTLEAQSDFSLLPYLHLLPTGQPQVFTQILTALDSVHPGIPQPLCVLDQLENYVERTESEISPKQLLSSWLDLDPDTQYLDPDTQFETWVHLLRRCLSAMPSQSGESGVSAYHEFKLLSALI